MTNINIDSSIISATAQNDINDTERLTNLLITELEARYPGANITVGESDSTISAEELTPAMDAALSKF